MSEISFPQKLWKLAKLPDSKIFLWSRSGETFLVNSRELDNYLKSSESTFDIDNSETFFWTMRSYGFQRVPAISEPSDYLSGSAFAVIQEFYHENFKGSAKCLLNVIEMATYDPEFSLSKQRKRARGDPCYRHVTFAPFDPLERARWQMRMTLDLCYVRGELAKTLDELQNGNENLKVIEIPPLYFDENVVYETPAYEANREVAGHYGLVTTEQLKEFFGDYLPVYADTVEENMKLEDVEFLDETTGEPLNEMEIDQLIDAQVRESAENAEKFG